MTVITTRRAIEAEGEDRTHPDQSQRKGVGNEGDIEKTEERGEGRRVRKMAGGTEIIETQKMTAKERRERNLKKLVSNNNKRCRLKGLRTLIKALSKLSKKEPCYHLEQVVSIFLPSN